MLMALLLPRVLERVRERSLMLAGGSLITLSLFLGLLAPGFLGLMGLWFLLGAGASLVMTPTGRLLKQSCQPEDRPALFAAQFSLSHGCWLVAYPLAGWGGAKVGLIDTFALLGTIALLSTVLAAYVWPSRAPSTLEHDHEPLTHNHLHYHDDHHQHDHEGWEGPEPHRHPHYHLGGRHRHDFVIDRHHLTYPK